MGVQWIYDLDVIAKLEKERQGEVGTPGPPLRPPGRPRPGPALPGRGPDQGGGGRLGAGGWCRLRHVGCNGCPPWPRPRHLPQADKAGAMGWGIEFTDPPQCPFFEYPSGRNSPYGEQTLVLLRCMAASGGLSCTAYAAAFAAALGEGFEGYRDVSTKVRRCRARSLPPACRRGPSPGCCKAVARLLQGCCKAVARLLPGWAWPGLALQGGRLRCAGRDGCRAQSEAPAPTRPPPPSAHCPPAGLPAQLRAGHAAAALRRG
jgi:hypothetical protein